VQKTDLVFLKHFAQLIAGLALLTVILAIAGYVVFERLGMHAENPLKKAEISARIAPIGGVFAGDTGRSAMLAAQQAATQALAAQVAFEGALDGALIYARVCGACHLTGAGGAPAPNATAWAPRRAKGLETLVIHAVDGFRGDAGLMPAKGGRPDLSDEQVKVAVEYMLNKYQ
jgi:cytochrome c5